MISNGNAQIHGIWTCEIVLRWEFPLDSVYIGTQNLRSNKFKMIRVVLLVNYYLFSSLSKAKGIVESFGDCFSASVHNSYLLLFSRSDMSYSLHPHGLQNTRLPIFHYLQEFAQTHVHWFDDAIQSPHPLLPPSPPALNLFQNQGLSQRISSLHQVAKVLEFQIQHQFFQWIFRTDFL